MSNTHRRQDCTCRFGLVLETAELVSGIAFALNEGGAAKVFEFQPSTSPFEVANAVDRDKPDVLFVEFSRTSKTAAEWILDVRHGEEMPLIVAVHRDPDPAEMVAAIRAGANEFLCLPVQPGIQKAVDRIGALLEARRQAAAQRGRVAGILSAKGGCGATTIACHLGAAVGLASGQLASIKNGVPRSRVLVADFDHQSPNVKTVLFVNPRSHSGNVFEAARRLSSHSWGDFVTPADSAIDLLSFPEGLPETVASQPEQWRAESLFRFISRQYSWVFVDLGRHLNASNWTFLQYIDELFIVTAPDVLALYQTRSVLQTLSSRGFDKSRVKMILNKNLSSSQGMWLESIQQMFEMAVFGVIPNDEVTLGKVTQERFEFPADTPFGKAVAKIAGKLLKLNGAAF